MAVATVDIGTLITCSPQVRGGRPRIAGTGISVQRIVPCYHANRAEIDAAIDADEQEADQIERQHTQTVEGKRW